MDTYEKKIREYLNNGEVDELYKNMLLNLFPELKESEDERIRKGLIKAVSRTFEGNKLYGTDVTREEALAWLEKKGRQKPALSEEDEEHIDSLLKRLDGLCRNEFERTRFAINEDGDWLKSLKQRIGG